MTKILSIAFLALLFSFQSILAQSNVTIGSSYDEVKGKEKYYFDIDDFIYTVKIKDKTSVFVQKIEKSSLKEMNKKLHSKIFSDEAETLKVLYANKKFYILLLLKLANANFLFMGQLSIKIISR